jgi:hypothetical protein
MRRIGILIAVAVCWVLFGNRAAADLKPADGGAPVFRIFAGSGNGSASSAVNISGKQPLLVISTARDVQLSTDRKAVRITLNSSDARKFADITRKHVKELLILEGNGRVLEAMQVGAPVSNGILEFSYPDDANVVDYLRKRFRLK